MTGSVLLSPPNSLGTWTQGINDNGQVLVQWQVPPQNQTLTGIWENGSLQTLPSEFDWAIAAWWTGKGVNEHGELGGRLSLVPPNEGYGALTYGHVLWENGEIVRIAALATDPTDIDALGWIGAVNDNGDVLAWTGAGVRLFKALPERVLALHVDPIRIHTPNGERKIHAGTSVTFTTLGGDPTLPAALYVMSPQGAFLFPIDLGPMDAAGHRQLTAPVPSSLTGLSVTLRAAALTGQGGVILSTPRTIHFD